ncbi:MAG: hypothetical protein ACOC53_01185 [Candidatus Saliniplasma sp.]
MKKESIIVEKSSLWKAIEIGCAFDILIKIEPNETATIQSGKTVIAFFSNRLRNIQNLIKKPLKEIFCEYDSFSQNIFIIRTPMELKGNLEAV